MINLAVTGGIACGKSLAARCLHDEGVDVCEADDLAREALQPGGAAYGSVVGRFGAGIVCDGRIDRAELGRRVFADSALRAELNALVHPGVRDGWNRWLRERPAGTRVAAVVIPLLYEIGDEGSWDGVWCVTSPAAEQMRRLRERGLTDLEAQRRMAAQLPLAVKVVRADVVIANYGTVDVLREQLRRAVKRIVESTSWEEMACTDGRARTEGSGAQ